MAVRTTAELLEALRTRTEGQTDDDTLAFISDVTDTLNDYQAQVKDNTNWKQKYEDNDKSWREKYKERFFTGSSDSDAEDMKEPQEEKKKLKFEDLFKEVK